MNCTVCNIVCIKSDEFNNSSNNVANIRNDSIICNTCVSVLDMMGSETKIKKEEQIKKEEPKIIKLKTNNSITLIYCPKCKKNFSTQSCKCGFKNPLFRK